MKKSLKAMSKVREFSIEFDRSVVAYVPGETINGRVFINLADTKTLRAVRIKIRGKAKVHWTENHYRNKSSHTDHYKKKEYYFKVFNELATSPNNKITLQAGQHSYPFSFRLPANIPCSYEHKYGYVRYSVKATLDKPWSTDHNTVSQFIVLSPYDLNTQQIYARPIHDVDEEEFHNCCCFSAGLMTVAVSCNKRGFAPGETVELRISYDRSSTDVDITVMRMKLTKHITLHGSCGFSSKKKRKKEVLNEVYRSGPFDKKGETSLRFVVPKVPPANLQHCSIIDVDYELGVYIDVSGMHSNMSHHYRVQLWDTLLAQ